MHKPCPRTIAQQKNAGLTLSHDLCYPDESLLYPTSWERKSCISNTSQQVSENLSMALYQTTTEISLIHDIYINLLLYLQIS